MRVHLDFLLDLVSRVLLFLQMPSDPFTIPQEVVDDGMVIRMSIFTVLSPCVEILRELTGFGFA
jgi:hypothetical protein